jgi:hypothetical protein
VIGFGLEMKDPDSFVDYLYFAERLEQLTVNTGFSPSSLLKDTTDETMLDTLKINRQNWLTPSGKNLLLFNIFSAQKISHPSALGLKVGQDLQVTKTVFFPFSSQE